MSRTTAPRWDEFELICERCGYCIEGLSKAARCPECGATIDASLPSARPGTPWQRGAGPISWVRTNLGMLFLPWPSLRSMAIEEPRSRSLRRINIAVASAMLTAAPAALAAVQLLRNEAPYVLRDLTLPSAGCTIRSLLVSGTVLLLWLGAALALSFLTKIESWGIRSFGRVHKSRVTATVADSITAHGTVGWVAGGTMAAIGFGLGLLLYERAMHQNVGALRGLHMLSPALLPMGAAMAGLLWFEIIVYIGVLRCRFANRARCASPPACLDGGTDRP